MEAFEQARQLWRGDAHAGVADGQQGTVPRRHQAHGDPALESELERVGHEVEDDLLPHATVDIDRLRQRPAVDRKLDRSEEHTSELQSLMRISYAVFCFNKKTNINNQHTTNTT